MVRDESKWAHWSKVIHDWRASGLTRNAYCQREGIKATTFDYWRPLIAEGKTVTPAPVEAKSVNENLSSDCITLVPVKVIEPPRNATPNVVLSK